MNMEKHNIRKNRRALRDSLPSAALAELSRAVLKNFKKSFFPALPAVKCAMAYMPVQSEVATSGIISFLLSRGIKIFLPCVRGDEISPARYTKGCKMTKGAFNIKEPSGGKGCRINSIGLVIVPGIAFDRRGNRIGFGKGFYDRFLKKLPENSIKAGVCLESQIVPSIPGERHDIKMDYIITEKAVIKI